MTILIVETVLEEREMKKIKNKLITNLDNMANLNSIFVERLEAKIFNRNHDRFAII